MKGHRERGPVSVVITTFNEGPMLREALQSVADQSILPQEVLVVDDGSKPVTAPAILEAFTVETGFAVKYVRQENAGPSAARNTGLLQAREMFIAYLDADDRWLPAHLERKLARLKERGTGYAVAYDGFVEFDHNTGRTLPTIAVGCHDGRIDAALVGVPGGVPAGMPFQLHRRAALLEVDGFDESLRVNEDFDLLLRLGRAGYRITGSGEPTVMRRVHPGSLTRLDPQRTLAELECFLCKAEQQGLMSQEAIAARRKRARLRLGKKQVAEAETTPAGIATLRHAFEHDGPRGLQEWAVFCVVRSRLLASLSFGAYRRVGRLA